MQLRLPAGSAAARRRFPGLDHDATLRDITVVADTGEVYVGDGAWVACLWALAGYRDLAAAGAAAPAAAGAQGRRRRGRGARADARRSRSG